MNHAVTRRRAFAPRERELSKAVRLELHKPTWTLSKAMRDLEKMKWEDERELREMRAEQEQTA